MVTLKIGVGPGLGSIDRWVGFGACCAKAPTPASVIADRMIVIVRLNMEGLCPESDVLTSGRRAARLAADERPSRYVDPPSGAVPQRTRGPAGRDHHALTRVVAGVGRACRVRPLALNRWRYYGLFTIRVF